MAATLSPKDVKKRMDEINDNFTEAREEIEAAMEAVGTTYFNEEAEYAKEVTEKTLGT
jgi:thermostable 8-oxoguanine DNA glycosylase